MLSHCTVDVHAKPLAVQHFEELHTTAHYPHQVSTTQLTERASGAHKIILHLWLQPTMQDYTGLYLQALLRLRGAM